MMFRQSPRRHQRNKGMRVKHAVQGCLLLGVCIWLVFYQYQMDHHHSSSHQGIRLSKKLSNASDFKLGRKDLKPKPEDEGHQPEKSMPQEAQSEHGGTPVGAKKLDNGKNKDEDGMKKKTKHHAENHGKEEKHEHKTENAQEKTKEKEEKKSKEKEEKGKDESKKKEAKEEKDDGDEKEGEKGSKKKENHTTESEVAPNSQTEKVSQTSEKTVAPSNGSAHASGSDFESSPTTTPAEDKMLKLHLSKKISRIRDKKPDVGSSTEARMDLDTLP